MHDIDLKDHKFGRDEASGIARLVTGISAATAEDEQRLARGATILDDLYEVLPNAGRLRCSPSISEQDSEQGITRSRALYQFA